jgi:hypothetical protein
VSPGVMRGRCVCGENKVGVGESET